MLREYHDANLAFHWIAGALSALKSFNITNIIITNKLSGTPATSELVCRNILEILKIIYSHFGNSVDITIKGIYTKKNESYR